MKNLDRYLKGNDVTRADVAKISGIPATTLAEYKKKEFDRMPVYIVNGIAMTIGKKPWEVLRDLQLLENNDDLNGFSAILKKYNATFPELEISLSALIEELADRGVTIDPFSFNRFENEEHRNVRKDLRTALENTIKSLEKALDNLEKGNAPLPE